ncbi:LysR family transcriptional regulator [Hydrogenophaga sp. OTU3427]|uniref:LysR family transcriptional regulator n=1 Tax=Hydrogenophaga sp. OTU3427 TaxID=3043856 RepID=UPI00313AABE3
MEIRQLKHLLTVARTGSFSRSAEELHLTQSALSRSIQSLEDEMGGPLLDRQSRHCQPTPLGETVLAHARRVLREVEALKTGTKDCAEGRRGSLALGLGPTASAILIRPLTHHMIRAHPGISLYLSSALPVSQLLELRARQLDIVIGEHSAFLDAKDLHIEHIAALKVAAVCRPGHPLVGRQGVSFTDLLEFPSVSTTVGPEIVHRLVSAFGPDAHPDRGTAMRCEDVGVLLDVARHTDAVYIGVRAPANGDLASGQLVELPVLTGLPLESKQCIVTLEDRWEALQQMLEIVRPLATSLLSDID